jgi:GST-like protein
MIEMALERAAAPWRQVRASAWEPGPSREKLRKLNPLGQVPVLVLPDGTVLTESAAILIHLGLLYPRSGLLPAAPSARARCLRGLVYVAVNCYGAVGINDHPGRWILRGTEADKERVRRAARRQMHRRWELFADTFPAKPFLSGAAPGALDFLAVVVSRWGGTRAHLARSRPAFLDLLRRIEAHPSVAPVLERHWPR